MTGAEAWQEIRALRAVPTGAAASEPDRRQTYAAALRQAEELADAAEVAGYAAKPLPLFYALSQAGRAVAAAHLPTPWQLRGHGLSVAANAASVLDTSLEPVGRGGDSFSGVARAVGSPPLGGAVPLGALWAANPDLLDAPIPESAGSWPRAIHVPIGAQSLSTSAPAEPAPDPSTTRVTTGQMLSAALALPGETAAEVVAAAQAYPTLRDVRPYRQGPSGAVWAEPDDVIARQDFGGSMRVNAAKEVPHEVTQEELWTHQRTFASVVEVDRRHASSATYYFGWALPELAGQDAPHPLMLWWALLLGLSSLARYEPAAWTAALDLDGSELAVGLERVLDGAAARVPQRLLEALRDG